MAHKVIEIQLTPKERALILRYGYPFEELEKSLLACKSSEIEIIPVKTFELEQLIGNLCISINELDLGRAFDQVVDLCDRMEYAERTGDGMLFDF